MQIVPIPIVPTWLEMKNFLQFDLQFGANRLYGHVHAYFAVSSEEMCWHLQVNPNRSSDFQQLFYFDIKPGNIAFYVRVTRK